jgi:RNA polymerase sigma-70 factor, ECF subfamily
VTACPKAAEQRNPFHGDGRSDVMGPAADESEDDVRPELQPVAESDGELLCRIADQDIEAFAILYRRYARTLYGLALRRLRDRERAEEATRQAFVAIWCAATTYAPEHDGDTRWLFTVARNAIADDVASVEMHEVASREPGVVAEDGWLTFRVHAAVAELPEPERVPLELAYWGGRSQSEIAELLGLPIGTVETRTRSALAQLALRLGDSDERVYV